jgi:hypothetical protein
MWIDRAYGRESSWDIPAWAEFRLLSRYNGLSDWLTISHLKSNPFEAKAPEEKAARRL